MYLLKSFATPVVWVLLLTLTGLILTRAARNGRRRFKLGWYVLLAGVALLYAFSLESVANLLTYPLESRYPIVSPDVLQTLDVVVVLGSGVYPSGPLRQGPDLGGEALVRFYHGVRYFRDSGADVIAFCGGPSRPGTEAEADVMRAMAVALGVPEASMVVESHSRNTMENIAGLAEVLPPGEGRRIGLVTSAAHMMRSKWVSERVFPHDTIVPVPVYFTYDPTGWSTRKITPMVGQLDRSTRALHEWIGILWYAVRY